LKTQQITKTSENVWHLKFFFEVLVMPYKIIVKDRTVLQKQQKWTKCFMLPTCDFMLCEDLSIQLMTVATMFLQPLVYIGTRPEEEWLGLAARHFLPSAGDAHLLLKLRLKIIQYV